MKKIVFVLLSIIYLSLPLFSQTNINLSNIELPKFDKRFFFHFDYLGNTENFHFIKGTADYINSNYYYACLYYQTDLETKKVNAISLLDYSIINDRVTQDHLKVYIYDYLNSQDKNKKVNIDLLEFTNFNSSKVTKRIYEFDAPDNKNSKIVIQSSISPDKQKIGIIMLVTDNYNTIQKIDVAIFDNSDELLWSQSVILKETNCISTDFYAFLSDNSELITVLNQFDYKLIPDTLIKHTVLKINEDNYSFHDFKPTLTQVQKSNIKFLQNGNIAFVNKIVQNQVLVGYDINIYATNGNKNLFVNIPTENQRNYFIYTPLPKKKLTYKMEYIDLHEKKNGELVLICEDVKSYDGLIIFKRKFRNIYVYQIDKKYSSINTLIIPYSLNFKSYNPSKEFTGMSKIYSYCKDDDIFLVYNGNINNHGTKTIAGIWKTNEDVYDNNNGIIITKINDAFKYNSTCLKHNLKSQLTLKQTLFLKMILFTL